MATINDSACGDNACGDNGYADSAFGEATIELKLKKMNFKKNILLLLLLGIVMPGLHSCKSKKQLVDAALPVEKKVEADLFADILRNQFDFGTFSAKLNLNLSSGTKSLSSKASLRIVKDKAIQLSIQPLFGVEVFRLYVDTDTLVWLDRMNKTYVKESIEELRKTYPVGFDYNTLQSLFTNRLFVSGKPEAIAADYEKFSINQASDMHYLLKSVDKSSEIEYSFAIDGNDRIALSRLQSPQDAHALQWQYADFALLANQTFPYKMDVSLASARRKVDVRIDFLDIVLDDVLELRASVPAGYSRASISDIVKILTNN